MENAKIKTPIWYWIISIFFLLWNLMGVISFFAHTFITDEALAALPDVERELYGDYPIWTTIVFAIAVFFGLFGALGLTLRKRWSKLAFIISFCAIIPQMAHNIFFTKSMDVYGPGQALTMPLMVVVFGMLLIWFSAHSIKKGWIK